MIVIVIMGVVYTLAINNFQKLDAKHPKLSLKNLKEYLSGFKHTKSVRLVCLDDCKSCFIVVDSKKLKIKIDDFLDTNVKTYRYDYDLGAMPKENDTYFNKEGVEENVCFSYRLDADGVGDQVLVEDKNRVYDFSSYMTHPAVYKSVEEAVNAKRSFEMEVK